MIKSDEASGYTSIWYCPAINRRFKKDSLQLILAYSYHNLKTDIRLFAPFCMWDINQTDPHKEVFTTCETGTTPSDSLHVGLKVFSYLSNVVSLISMFWTLLIYIIFKDLQKDGINNILYLVAALFCGQLLFQISGISIITSSYIVCKMVGTLLHLFWLMSFLCMSCISLDLAYKTNSNWHRTSRKFKALYCVLFAMIFVMICLMLDLFTPLELEYGIERGICFLQTPFYQMILFVIPVASMLFLNTILFFFVVIKIYKTNLQSHRMTGTERYYVCVYARILSLFGISWITALLPSLTNINELHYVFTFINLLQSLFFFVSFGFNETVRQRIWRCWLSLQN